MVYPRDFGAAANGAKAGAAVSWQDSLQFPSDGGDFFALAEQTCYKDKGGINNAAVRRALGT